MNIKTPLDQGLIHLKTRIAVPPMATQSTEGGLPGTRTAAHYKVFAENPNVGLVITEHSYIDPQGKADPYQMAFDSDAVIPAQAETLLDTGAADLIGVGRAMMRSLLWGTEEGE
jgi:NADPH2 dehydrogenase